MIFQGTVLVLVKGTQVAALGQGESFGELGLDNKTVRTATVKVTQEESCYDTGVTFAAAPGVVT